MVSGPGSWFGGRLASPGADPLGETSRQPLPPVDRTKPGISEEARRVKALVLAGETEKAHEAFGDLVAAQGRATAETLIKNGCPVRTLHLPCIDEESLGELLMHFMLETIIAAQLLGVDAFDQPAVEEGKILAKKYLSQ